MKKIDPTLSWSVNMAEKNGLFNIRDFFLLTFLVLRNV